MNKKKQEALETVCMILGITEDDADFYGTYNPMAYYERLVEKRVPQHEAMNLIKEYQPFYDKVIKLIGGEK